MTRLLRKKVQFFYKIFYFFNILFYNWKMMYEFIIRRYLMPEKKIVSTVRKTKIIQLILLLIIEITFVAVLVINPSLGMKLFDEQPLFALCAVTWILMLFSLLCLLNDFYALRSFTKESHALNKIAYLDNLTGIPNRHGLDVIFQTYDSPDSMAQAACYMTTINNLKELNKTRGRTVGDVVLRDFSSILEQVGDNFGNVGRNGGNEFLAVINNCTVETMKEFESKLNSEIAAYNQQHPLEPIHLTSTYVLNCEEHISAFPQLLIATYNQLHSLL